MLPGKRARAQVGSLKRGGVGPLSWPGNLCPLKPPSASSGLLLLLHRATASCGALNTPRGDMVPS